MSDTAIERDLWLQARRLGIGGSDAAAILGLSRYATPLQIYLDKVGASTPRVDSDEMRWGRTLEPLIVDEYARSREVEVRRNVFATSPDRPWMFGSLDGMSADNRVVEAKAVGFQKMHEWGEEGSDYVPTEYLIQVQHYMAVTGAESADVAALFGGQRFRIYTVARDAELIDTMVDRLQAFWDRVLLRRPPAPEPEDASVMRLAYPPTEAIVELDDDACRLADAYRIAGDRAKEAERERDGRKVELLARLAGASLGLLPDGRKIKQTVVDVKEHTVKASSYVRMTIQEPKKAKVKV